MNRDPLYRRIVEALEQPLDGNAFQACAVALLGKVYPNLTPLPGGDDAGMDGAFGTDEGPYPLVCTVQENVIGNFRNNSSTYLAKRRGPKLAVVATSQRLTNRQKRNLEEQANALGVTIVNIHDRTYFANQLYRDPRWRLELLGIPDDLPPLSILPRVGRFAPPDILVGRKGDLEWLKSVHADLLLVPFPADEFRARKYDGVQKLRSCRIATGIRVSTWGIAKSAPRGDSHEQSHRTPPAPA